MKNSKTVLGFWKKQNKNIPNGPARVLLGYKENDVPQNLERMGKKNLIKKSHTDVLDNFGGSAVIQITSWRIC